MWFESDASICNDSTLDWLENVDLWIFWWFFIEILMFTNLLLKIDKLLYVLSSLCGSETLSVMQVNLDDFFEIFIVCLFNICF